MRAWIGLAAAAALVAAVAGVQTASGRGGSARTEVVWWSPFESSGAMKQGFHVQAVPGGCEVYGARVGGMAYKCALTLKGRDYLIDPCWRDGSRRMGFVVCVTSPWERTAYRLRVPRLLLDTGVTFGSANHDPWAIELTDGNRCELPSHFGLGVQTPTGMRQETYICARHVYLLNFPLRGTRLWRIGAVRDADRIVYLGEVSIRRVFFGALPSAMKRQNSLAGAAAAVAERVTFARWRTHLSRVPVDSKGLYAERVRLTLPDAAWANVRVRMFWKGNGPDRTAAVILHRTRQGWATALQYRPYCRKLPSRVREQIFSSAEC